jgi:hypothetical protein
MALTADIRQQVFDLLSRASTLSFVSSDDESVSSLGLRPGQAVMAEVLTTLPNRLVQVRIANERLNLDLPMEVRAGQTLEMTYVADAPRATFAIARPAGATPEVTLSDASRLLGLLAGNEQLDDPQLRASLQSVGDLLRKTSGEAGVLANLMDEVLTYGGTRGAGALSSGLPGGQAPGNGGGATAAPFDGNLLAAQKSLLSLFEANASQILQQIAGNSRFDLSQAVNAPVVPLPLVPGQVVDATVLGSLPGGRTFIQVAGTELELVLPHTVQEGEILRLTFISGDPKPLFAFQRQAAHSGASGELSEAGRWLSVLEHSESGASNQQMYVLERLNTVLRSLPADSPAFIAIRDEAVTYHALLSGGRPGPEEQAPAVLPAAALPLQATTQAGNGISLSDDMVKLLQALIRGTRLALLEALNQQAMTAGLVPGQQVKGEVLALLGGGRFLVQVAGMAFEFNMPKGTRPGSRVNLFFITEEPRPTFLLARFGRPGDSSVSDTGRWLSGFVGAAAEQAPAQGTAQILGTLLAGPPGDASLVGRMLRQGLQESGLFYESHLTRWFGGDYSLEDILREPQGRLSPFRQPSGGVVAEEVATPAGLRPGSPEMLEAALKKMGAAAERDFVADRGVLPVVREQLTALQSGQVAFNGELFPGQSMEWSVRERDSRRNSAGEREHTWDTSLRLNLPRLGTVEARLTLDGSRVSIDVRADDAGTAVMLDNARPGLAEQLEAAGLVPGEIGVRHDAD